MFRECDPNVCVGCCSEQYSDEAQKRFEKKVALKSSRFVIPSKKQEIEFNE
jgi:hypothetical protein